MTTHGPMPKISMDLRTGSVVVPAVASTMATSCPVMALMRELLPLFLRPKMPICGLLLIVLNRHIRFDVRMRVVVF